MTEAQADSMADQIRDIPLDDDPETGAGPEAIDGEILSPSDFEQVMRASLQACSMVSGLDSPAKSADLASFSPACRELYDTIADTTALNWMLDSSNLTIRRMAVIGAWMLPTGISIAQEIRARRAKPQGSPSGAKNGSAGVRHQAKPESSPEGPPKPDRRAYD